jgi:hypothetical protein
VYGPRVASCLVRVWLGVWVCFVLGKRKPPRPVRASGVA